MELGQVQKAWIADMKKYPERQIDGKLGWIDSLTGDIKACCLGQGVLTLCDIKGIKPSLENSFLCDIDTKDYSYPTYSYKELGLRDDRAELKDGVNGSVFGRVTKQDHYYSLSQMNDGGITWKEIAHYMENHPDNVFVESK